MNERTYSKVLELFNKHRKLPSADFDSSHFADFLLKEPCGRGAFRNSFSGLRRFNAFWDEVQLEFGVCFSIKDRETDYSLEEFCIRIEQLVESSRSSKASLRNRAKYGFEWNVFLVGNLLLVALLIALKDLAVVVVPIWVGIFALNYVVISNHFKEKRYIKDLEARIQESADI